MYWHKYTVHSAVLSAHIQIALTRIAPLLFDLGSLAAASKLFVSTGNLLINDKIELYNMLLANTKILKLQVY